MNRALLKRRIATSADFDTDERAFLLVAIDSMPDTKIERHVPPNFLPRIDAIYAVLSVDEHGEGIVAAPIGPYPAMPLIAADNARLVQIIPIAKQFALLTHKRMRLVKFEKRTVIDEF